ncbi:hypothetical protein ABW20_dc0110411 [Dactylellina cionopaga]|nr:hypothetical protein ABW20_dc0110411 [Dactylellina cionopaga]
MKITQILTVVTLLTATTSAAPIFNNSLGVISNYQAAAQPRTVEQIKEDMMKEMTAKKDMPGMQVHIKFMEDMPKAAWAMIADLESRKDTEEAAKAEYKALLDRLDQNKLPGGLYYINNLSTKLGNGPV